MLLRAGTRKPRTLSHPVKSQILIATLSILALSAHSGDAARAPLGKAPLDKVPVEECLDLGASIFTVYDSSYLYKGYLFGQDSISTGINYQFEGLAFPLTASMVYTNVAAGGSFSNATNDDLALGLLAGLPTIAGVDASLSYVYHFYPEDQISRFYPSSQGELGLHFSRDFQVAVLKFDLFYNNSAPNAFNGMVPGGANNDSGAWYWDLGLEREFDVLGHGLILGGGVAFADNYWGRGPNFRNGGRSSGWSHYYLEASLPIALNCRTTLTPFVGFVGAPDSWLMDGMPNWLGLSGQSDILHGGVNLNVAF